MPTMQIGMERGSRSAIDERQRHLERHTRLGDTPATLVLARSGHELARFLGVAPRTRSRKPVRGLRLAKVRPVVTHEMHPAELWKGMAAAEYHMRAASIASGMELPLQRDFATGMPSSSHCRPRSYELRPGRSEHSVARDRCGL